MRLVDRVQPAGFNASVDVYELIAARPGLTTLPTSVEASADQFDLCDLWVRAYDFYAGQDWGSALEAFETVCRHYPNDGPSRVYVERCRELVETPPGPDWDGVTILTSK